MQLIEGESLADRIRTGPLALGDVVALGSALGDALTYVHRHGVVHRDIKPGNVLLDTDGRPHLSDFGIAVLADATNITATGMVIGTASYLSPEQVRGQPVGPASDVYALGLVLLECITARREYPGNALEAAVARLHRAPEIPARAARAAGQPARRDDVRRADGAPDHRAGRRRAPRAGPRERHGRRDRARPGARHRQRRHAHDGDGPGTGPTAYAPMAGPATGGATRRMGTPPGGYGPAAAYGTAGYGAADPTALVGGQPAPRAAGAEARSPRRSRGPARAAARRRCRRLLPALEP